MYDSGRWGTSRTQRTTRRKGELSLKTKTILNTPPRTVMMRCLNVYLFLSLSLSGWDRSSWWGWCNGTERRKRTAGGVQIKPVVNVIITIRTCEMDCSLHACSCLGVHCRVKEEKMAMSAWKGRKETRWGAGFVFADILRESYWSVCLLPWATCSSSLISVPALLCQYFVSRLNNFLLTTLLIMYLATG